MRRNEWKRELSLFFPQREWGDEGRGAEGGSDFTVFGDDGAGRPTHWAGMFGAPAGDFQSAGLQHVHSTVAGPESSFLGDQGAMTGVLDVGAVALSLHVQLFSRMGRGGKERENVETITVWQTTTCKQEVSTTVSLRPNYNFFYYFVDSIKH